MEIWSFILTNADFFMYERESETRLHSYRVPKLIDVKWFLVVAILHILLSSHSTSSNAEYHSASGNPRYQYRIQVSSDIELRSVIEFLWTKN